MLTVQGRIIKGVGGLYTVLAEDGRLYECPARGVFRLTGDTPYVGDWVTVREDKDGCVLAAIAPRSSFLQRPPVANLDRALFVVSTVEPAPNLLILDRQLAIAECKGIDPVLVFTKCDLAPPDELATLYTQAGFQTICVRPDRPCRDAVLPLLAGHVSALAGNSGVGKSTLLNAVLSGLRLDTGEISQKLGRGRHTTRHVELYPVELPGAERGFVADTPGFSSWDAQHGELIVKEALARGFREFAPYADACRFTGCSHTKEKGCAVLEAVARGDIPKSRHAHYCALYEEVRRLAEWELKDRNGVIR